MRFADFTVNGLLIVLTGDSLTLKRHHEGEPAAAGQLPTDGVAGLARGGGPYACWRIGLASRLPAIAR